MRGVPAFVSTLVWLVAFAVFMLGVTTSRHPTSSANGNGLHRSVRGGTEEGGSSATFLLQLQLRLRGGAMQRLRGGSNASSEDTGGETVVEDMAARDGVVLPCQARRCRFAAVDPIKDPDVEAVIRALDARGWLPMQCSLCGASPMHRSGFRPYTSWQGLEPRRPHAFDPTRANSYLHP